MLRSALLGACLVWSPAAFAAGPACPPAGAWVDGATGALLSADAAIRRLAASDAILLGESHGFADIHLWQALTASGISALRGGGQYAYEMLPRSAQPALSAWAAGASTRAEFLAAAGWSGGWGFAADAYDPILRLPRLQNAPAIAMNVGRDLVRKTGREGWGAVSPAEREGLSDPAPALPEYRALLADVVARKAAAGSERHAVVEEASRASDAMLDRFVAAQLVWDRAFAEAIQSGLARHPDRPVIAFLGRGHVEHGHGVAHQLAALGVSSVATAIPVFAGDDCSAAPDAAGRPIAGLLYGLPAPEPEPEPAARPRIGVFIGDAPEAGGALITRVSESSPAEVAGFLPGDIVTEAAGQPVAKAADLSAAIRRHSWGAWLPFQVSRDGAALELVAKLPKAPPP